MYCEVWLFEVFLSLKRLRRLKEHFWGAIGLKKNSISKSWGLRRLKEHFWGAKGLKRKQCLSHLKD